MGKHVLRLHSHSFHLLRCVDGSGVGGGSDGACPLVDVPTFWHLALCDPDLSLWEEPHIPMEAFLPSIFAFSSLPSVALQLFPMRRRAPGGGWRWAFLIELNLCMLGKNSGDTALGPSAWSAPPWEAGSLSHRQDAL